METEAMRQHLEFQTYLMNQKIEVKKKLRNKIFPSTSYEDYKIINIVGQGSFGQVVAAQNMQNKNVFAIKIIPKKNLVKGEQLIHLKSEIRILHSISFEFLISLETYFTNRCFVFIVLPYIDGGHFFRLLRSVERLDENCARFFAGQIVLAIEYLHYMGIIYRDLKPENLLLDLQGYLKLVDFGLAKEIGNSHAYSFCGTPEYLAPEVLLRQCVQKFEDLYVHITRHSIKPLLADKYELNGVFNGKGYTESPDWWTLGILIYEMCNGSPPFTSSHPLKLYEKILVGVINWPKHFSYELKSIIQGLLQVDKTKRLGCMKKRAEDVKFHRWFSSLDWNALWNKKISPPVKFHAKTVDQKNSRVFNYSSLYCKSYVPSEMIGNIDFAI